MNGRGEYGRTFPTGTRGCQRGEYSASRARMRHVPVIAVVDRASGGALLTTSSAIWDPVTERSAGGGPSYYTQHDDGGWWYFLHPEGEVWFGGRRFRPIRPRGSVMVIESDPSLRVSGIVHTRSEYEAALDQLNTDFATFMSEFITIMGGDPKGFPRSPKLFADMIRDPKLASKLLKAYATLEKSPLYAFYKSTLVPLYAEWNTFIQEPISLIESMSGGLYGLGPGVFAKLERWQARLQAARAATNVELSKHGKSELRSPGSVALPKSWVDKGEEAIERTASGLGDIGSVLKYAVIGVLVIGGVVAVSSLASTFKKTKTAAPSTSATSTAKIAVPTAKPTALVAATA